MDESLPCLSIRQPWALAICSGIKSVENRSWSTQHRGLLAIHAAASRQDLDSLIEQNPGTVDPAEFARGMVIGVADLVDVVPLNPSIEDNPWAIGPYCWLLENARLLPTPLPFKGRLHLYTLPSNLTAGIRWQVSHGIKSQPIDPQMAESLQPSMPEVWVERAKIYAEQADPDEVIRCCTEAIMLREDYAYAYYLRAVAYIDRGEFELGLDDCDQTTRLAPTAAGVQYLRHLAYEGQGDILKAQENLAGTSGLDASLPDEMPPGT